MQEKADWLCNAILCAFVGRNRCLRGLVVHIARDDIISWVLMRYRYYLIAFGVYLGVFTPIWLLLGHLPYRALVF